MRRQAGLLLLLAALCGCKAPEDSHAQAIVGAVLIDGTGGPPLSNSIVLVAEGRIVQAGRHGEIPVSSETAKLDGSGRYIVPAFVDLSAAADTPKFAAPGPSTAEDARAQVARFASAKPSAIHLWPANLQPAIVAAIVESARDAGIPVAGHPANQAEAELLVQDGATSLIGMLHDTDAIDPAFVTRLRDLRIVYAPELNQAPAAGLDRARKNTARLFAAGVPLGLAAAGGDWVHECELMAESGVPALDVIVAATGNGARALGQSEHRGTIQDGKRADLLLLRANPGEDIRNLRRLDRRMVNGEWH
jgi:imidazolonepropionase-like amidohydrolase